MQVVFASISIDDERQEQQTNALDQEAAELESPRISLERPEKDPQNLLSTLNPVPVSQAFSPSHTWFEQQAFEEDVLALAELIEQNRSKEARAQLTALRQRFPHVIALEYFAALIDLQEGDVMSARDRLLLVVGQVPGFQPAHYALAYVLIGQGDVERTRIILRQLPEQALPTLQLQALLAYRTRDYLNAQRLVIALSEQMPQDGWSPFLYGLLLAELGDRQRATALFQESIRRNPLPPAFAYLAASQMALGDRQAALETVERARELFPTSPLPLVLRRYLLDPNDVQAMIDNFQQLLALVPQSTDLWIDYIRYLGSVQQLDIAEQAITAFEQQGAESAQLKRLKGELAYQKGETAYDSGDYAQAIIWHQAAPSFRPAHRQLYATLSRRGRGLEAEETIRSALRQFPGDKEFSKLLNSGEQ